jgi:hypothetical protein
MQKGTAMTTYSSIKKDVAMAAQDAADTVKSSARKTRIKGKAGVRAVNEAVETGARKVQAVGVEATEAVKDLVGNLKDSAKDVLDTAIAEASEASDENSTIVAMRDTAVEKAEGARETLSDVGDQLARTLARESAAEESGAIKSQVYASVADGLSAASKTLRERSISEIGQDLHKLVNRHPGAFMAVAAVAGFAAARFLRSSSKRTM